VQYSRFSVALSSAARLPWATASAVSALVRNLRVGFLGERNFLASSSWLAALLRAGLVLLRGVAQEKFGVGLTQCRFIGAWIDLEEHAARGTSRLP